MFFCCSKQSPTGAELVAHGRECGCLQLWHERYGKDSEPHYMVNAPGRVNLIGEHVDHQDYSVLPCAILPSVKAAVRVVPNEDGKLPALQIYHKEPDRFTSKTFQRLADIVITEHHWTNYILAAYMGVMEYLVLGKNSERVGLTHDVKAGISEEWCKKAGKSGPCCYSIQMLFAGNVPEAAGLSSSSALVCCAAIAFDMVNGFERHISPPVLADVTAKCERYVGTAGGGMDQAAILCSKEGYAQHIGFNPLTLDPVALPMNIAVIVANTGREAPKAVSAAKMYNKRVFELRAACVKIISKVDPAAAAKLNGAEVIGLGLRNVLRTYVKMGEKEFLDKLQDYLEDRIYTKADIDAILGGERRQYLLEKRCGVDVWTKNDDFYLYPRIRHVLTETLRVSRFVELCKEHVVEGQETPDKYLVELGQLINESGDSLSSDFDAGCKEITEICEIGRRNGALGARLTGAGWGGATVHLVRKADADRYVEILKKEYFEPYMTGAKKASPPLEFLPKSMEDIGGALFATIPGAPATAMRF